MKYQEIGERILLVNPDTEEETVVELEPEKNPRRSRPSIVQMPVGPYEDLFVRVALVRHPEYGKHKDITIKSSADAYKLLKTLENLPQESMFVLLLNTQNKVVGITEALRGSWNQVIMKPTDLFRAAIVANAPAIILVHNHPSGELKTSADDVNVWKKAQEAGNIIGVKVLDFLIVGDGRYLSMADTGAD
jgi:DNA repair protein RadC